LPHFIFLTVHSGLHGPMYRKSNSNLHHKRYPYPCTIVKASLNSTRIKTIHIRKLYH